MVTVHALAGDWSIFRPNGAAFANESWAENMDLSPLAARGGQSHFRGRYVGFESDARRAAKIGTVPCERLQKLFGKPY